MLFHVLVVLLGGWFLLVLIRIIRLFLAHLAAHDQKSFKLVVLLGDQDDTVEGFLRKLIGWRNILWPRLEVIVMDDYSVDHTGKIIELLSRELDFKVITRENTPHGLGKEIPLPLEYTSEIHDYYYDARGLKGPRLLQAPIFSLMKTI